MNYMYFVDERLRLALHIFNLGTPPFEEIKRKVEASEPPYEYRGRDDAVEDAYQEAFEDADTAIQVIGMSSLGLVQTALHEFLKEFVERSFGPAILKQVPQIKADGWLGKFRALFASNADYDWANSGADLALIEQACLTRNDFHHSVNLLTRYPHQGKTHAEKYADSPFRDPAFAGALMQEYPLRVTRELLESSIAAVRTLCQFLVDVRRRPKVKSC
jgi:hypothetical protein